MLCVTLNIIFVFRLYLNPNQTFFFWIHDPNIFIQSINPDVIPHLKVLVEPGQKNYYLYIRPVYHSNINREGKVSNPQILVSGKQ